MNTDLILREQREQRQAAEITKLAALYQRLNGLNDALPVTSHLTCRGLINFIIAHEVSNGRLPSSFGMG